jgi:hypothetical protein
VTEPERWQCIALKRSGEGCSRVVPFSLAQLESGLQPLCHQHHREVEEGLQREDLGSAAPTLSMGLHRCVVIRKMGKGRAIRCGKPAPCLSLRGQDGHVVLSQHICDDHRFSLAHALMREWQAQQTQSGTPSPSGRRWGWQLSVRPG